MPGPSTTPLKACSRTVLLRRWLVTTGLVAALAGPCLVLAGQAHADADDADEAKGAIALPTGQRLTPTAAPRALFQPLVPDLAQFPGFKAGQAISTATSPDHKTLLILTSGYNRLADQKGAQIDAASEEYVFVYDISAARPAKKQVLKVPNTFAGLAFTPDGKSFYVSGGVDDSIHVFAAKNGIWAESGTPIPLGHASGLGLNVGKEPRVASGLDLTADGRYLVIANLYNDSISLIDLKKRAKVGELDLRPGKRNSSQKGVAGGEYPLWVRVKGNDTAYVSSLRDREIVVVSLKAPLSVTARVKVAGNPNKMILDRAQRQLFVTEDNADRVSVIDTATNRIVDRFPTTAPADILTESLRRYTGSSPNSLALSPDERTLYVTNGNTSSVAVIGKEGQRWAVKGLVPTGWYPNAVSLSGDGRTMYVVNGKSVPGPNPKLKEPGGNQYILQLEKAGFLTVPVPEAAALDELTRQVAANNNLRVKPNPKDTAMMRALHKRIKHIIYVIKENRTYDQILGDLPTGNGDPSLAMFGRAITPNFHRLATDFVNLDNFYDSGETSGNGWPWSTSARESDLGTKALPVEYAGRGFDYEWEGPNRNINVAVPTVEQRQKLNPATPDDPDLLPGAVNVAAPDGPKGTAPGKGYVWDAVLRAHLDFREYGCMSDLSIPYPLEPHAFAKKVVQSRPGNPELLKNGDPYYRGFEPGYPDFWREAEWEREFDLYVAKGELPALEMVQMPVDHMGSFDTAISGVDTPETQQADNDYAFARLVEKVAASPFKDDTLIIGLEDDAQDGPDHVDAHRSTAYFVGPYVKHKAVVHSRYTTVNVIRTIEDILGTEHSNLNTATQRPMTEVFDLKQKEWSFKARPAAILKTTRLPLPKDDAAAGGKRADAREARPVHDAAWWAERTRGYDFSAEDRIDADAFNRLVWNGLMGDRPYPQERSGLDLSRNRQALLAGTQKADAGD